MYRSLDSKPVESKHFGSAGNAAAPRSGRIECARLRKPRKLGAWNAVELHKTRSIKALIEMYELGKWPSYARQGIGVGIGA